MTEEWNVILSAPNYEASSLGRIRRKVPGAGARAGRILKQAMRSRYLAVTIGGSSKYVHRLVTEAFFGEAPFDGAHAAHRDGDTSHNAVANLYWATPKQNADDKERHHTTARGERCGASKIASATALAIREFSMANTISATATKFGMSRSQVHRIKHAQSWGHL